MMLLDSRQNIHTQREKKIVANVLRYKKQRDITKISAENELQQDYKKKNRSQINFERVSYKATTLLFQFIHEK